MYGSDEILAEGLYAMPLCALAAEVLRPAPAMLLTLAFTLRLDRSGIGLLLVVPLYMLAPVYGLVKLFVADILPIPSKSLVTVVPLLPPLVPVLGLLLLTLPLLVEVV